MKKTIIQVDGRISVNSSLYDMTTPRHRVYYSAVETRCYHT